jgi:hypothetical protein
LRAAWGDLDPAPGFAVRVAARAHRPPAPRRRQIPRWVMAAATLALIAAAALTVWGYRRQRQQDAARQLRIALNFTQYQLSHITGVALSHAVQRLNQETP